MVEMAVMPLPGLGLAEERDATFSECRTWRYDLLRRWDNGPLLNVVGLNPSTADEVQDDPTIRRCIGFAKRWGYSGMLMTNIFGLRSTDPRGLSCFPEPVGAGNNEALVGAARGSAMVLAAWGAWGDFNGRGAAVCALLRGLELWCLGTTASGQPRHPLYLRADSVPWLLGRREPRPATVEPLPWAVPGSVR